MAILPFEDLFKQIKFNLWLMGIPYDDFKFKFRCPFFNAFLWLLISGQVMFIISKVSAENLLELTQLTPCLCIGSLSMLKIIAVAMKRRKIYRLTESLKQLYDVMNIDVEMADRLQPRLVFLKFFTKCFFALNWALIAVYCFFPVTMMLYYYLKHNEVKYHLPFAILLPFKIDGWLSWTCAYFHSALAGYISTFYYNTADALYYVLSSHICNNFMIVTNKFKKMNVPSAALLLEIVKDHQYIIKLSEDLNDIFSAPNMFNVLIGSIEICALGFNITMGDLKQVPGCILFLVSALLQMLMMSVFGENIITESSNVGEAAYACNWYKLDEKSKKIIQIILSRTAKPQQLTAYKFSVISYKSFSKILSTSWTYFTILKTVYIPPAVINKQ